MDKIVDFLYQPAQGSGLLYGELIVYGIAGLLVFLGILVAVTAIRANRPVKSDDNYRKVQCASCGWEGMVSRYVRNCPKCNDSNFVARA